MSKSLIHFFFLFIAMVLIQVICNRICLFNVAVPFVFIYFILRLPINLNANWVITLSFAIGLTIDIFSNTQGMNALACTVIGGLKKPVFTALFPREDEMTTPIPSIQTLGVGNYIKYLFTLTLIYCTMIFLIQSFSFHDFKLTFFRIICSSILSAIIMFGFDCLATTRREKRL